MEKAITAGKSRCRMGDPVYLEEKEQTKILEHVGVSGKQAEAHVYPILGPR